MKPKLDISHTCQNCRRRVETTRQREIRTKDYMGPCGDSFCYASCTSPSCVPIHVTVCDDCAKKLAKK